MSAGVLFLYVLAAGGALLPLLIIGRVAWRLDTIVTEGMEALKYRAKRHAKDAGNWSVVRVDAVPNPTMVQVVIRNRRGVVVSLNVDKQDLVDAGAHVKQSAFRRGGVS